MSEVTTNISNVDTFCVRLFETNLLSEFKLFKNMFLFIAYRLDLQSTHSTILHGRKRNETSF